MSVELGNDTEHKVTASRLESRSRCAEQQEHTRATVNEVLAN